MPRCAGILRDHRRHGASVVCRTAGAGAVFVLRMTALELRAEPGQVSVARRHVRDILRGWGLEVVTDDCQAVVSELVTNAIRAAASIAAPAGAPPVRLRLIERAQALQVEVWDASDDMPETSLADSYDEGGRGLLIVAALAARHGVYRTAGGGKCIWAVLTAQSGGSESAAPATGRTSPGSHREEAHPVTTATADNARHILARDPLLRWDAIAAHARDHHGTTWPSDDAAITAIVGAFDAVVPHDCGYSPTEGTITSPPLSGPPSWVPAWNDPELLNCTIAALAASAAECDLEEIYNKANVIAPHPS